VPTDERGRVEAFIEKPRPEEAPTNLINAGFYVLEATVLDRIAPEGKVNIERVTFPAMVTDGSLYALASDEYWHDTGTPERYLQGPWDLLKRARHGPPAPGAVELRPCVWRQGDVTADGDVQPTSF